MKAKFSAVPDFFSYWSCRAAAAASASALFFLFFSDSSLKGHEIRSCFFKPSRRLKVQYFNLASAHG